MIAEIKPLEFPDLSTAVDLDVLLFGGWWSLQSYQQEWERPSSSLIGLHMQPADLGGSDASPTDAQSESLVVSPRLIGTGCLWRIEDEAHITLLGVHPHYQGRGLGQALLLALLQTAQFHEAARASLEVNAANTPAIALYTKFGFQIAGRRPHYYGKGEDALILWQGDLQTPLFLRSLQQCQVDTEQRLASWGCQVLRIDVR
ncbi:MAG: GNAT family N-acetyltransferase [Acaryochloris sp. RU_4_1]|nr:GNAT family N-acetyltransferase [Acaryochloris sp. RU_4_1]NJR53699.1 GNAT family N-acetyltransferase [Acaryochloris sp. CRU_2_0]